MAIPPKKQIDEQLERLCGAHGVLPAKQARLLRYLINADFKLTSQAILLGFEEQELGQPINPKTAKTIFDRAKRLVSDLSRSLRLYYYELPVTAPDRILIQIEPPRSSKDSRYQPKIAELVPEIKNSYDERVRLVGDIFKALEYVTEQIPNLNRIEETFVRWVDMPSSLYSGNTFLKFLEALKNSNLRYRAVLGPVTDPAGFSHGGLREVLASRKQIGEDSAKLYRLLHNAALMDFTLLYYFEDASDFYRQTENIEVLFGYVVHDTYERVDTTVVFGSRDRLVVNEFKKLFTVLRHQEFSRQLLLDRPDLFHDEPRQCDILATFPQLPEEEILRRIRASGTGESPNKAWSASKQDGKERDDAYWLNKPHIKICVTALKFLDDKILKDELKRALNRGVQVSVALWEKGPFTDARASVIELAEDEVAREMEGSRSVVRFLGKHENLFSRLCTGKLGSVSIIWIDELIYFSPYWVGKDVSDGPHFLTMANSTTGRELRDQYAQMLEGADLARHAVS